MRSHMVKTSRAPWQTHQCQFSAADFHGTVRLVALQHRTSVSCAFLLLPIVPLVIPEAAAPCTAAILRHQWASVVVSSRVAAVCAPILRTAGSQLDIATSSAPVVGVVTTCHRKIARVRCQRGTLRRNFWECGFFFFFMEQVKKLGNQVFQKGANKTRCNLKFFFCLDNAFRFPAAKS